MYSKYIFLFIFYLLFLLLNPGYINNDYKFIQQFKLQIEK